MEGMNEPNYHTDLPPGYYMNTQGQDDKGHYRWVNPVEIRDDLFPRLQRFVADGPPLFDVVNVCGAVIASGITRTAAARLAGLLLRSPMYSSVSLRELKPTGRWMDVPSGEGET